MQEVIVEVKSCPLCNKEATYKVVKEGRAKMYECPQCNCFVVSKSVEQKLPELDQVIVNNLSQYSSRSPNDKVLHIHYDDLSNIVAHYVSELKIQ